MAEWEAHQSFGPTSCLSDWAWASLSSVSTLPLWGQWLVLSWCLWNLLNVEYLVLMPLMVLSVSLSWVFRNVFLNVPCGNIRLEASRRLFEEILSDLLLSLFWWEEICAVSLPPPPNSHESGSSWKSGTLFYLFTAISSVPNTDWMIVGWQSTNIFWMNRWMNGWMDE